MKTEEYPMYTHRILSLWITLCVLLSTMPLNKTTCTLLQTSEVSYPLHCTLLGRESLHPSQNLQIPLE